MADKADIKAKAQAAKEQGVWTRSRVIHLLDNDDRAVEKALRQIYARQTEDEQTVKATHDHNSVGFTAFDAQLLTRFAEDLDRYGSLTPNKIKTARGKVGKYWRQLLQVVEASGAPVVYTPTK